ncbi:flippase [Candidatus Pacearchaeota archaeon]|nr:flippase [Candidatus Pacearchaeota archaeon]
MQKKTSSNVDSSLKLLAKSSFVVLIGVVLSKLLSYIYRIIIARQFGPQEYGLFSLAVAVLGIFITVATFGFNEGIVRYVAIYRANKENKKISYLRYWSLATTAVSSIIAGILLYVFADSIALGIFHSSVLIIYLKVFSIALPLSILGNIFLDFLRAYEKIGWYSFIFNILQNVVKVIAILLLLVISVSSSAIIYSYVLSIVAILIASYFACKAYLPEIFFKEFPEKNQRKRLRAEFLSYSGPMLFFGVVYMAFYWVDSFMLGYFKSPAEVGLYNAALPLAMLLNIVPDLFMQLFFPLITKEYARKNYEVIKELSKQVSKWILMINLPLVIFIIVFPERTILAIWGSEYIKASTALQILTLGTLITALTAVSNRLIYTLGKSRTILTNGIVAWIINIILDIALIPRPRIGSIDNSLGINGAAIATLISVSVFSLLFVIEAYKNTGIFPLRRKMINILAAGLVCAIAVIFIHGKISINIINSVLIAIVLCVIYVGILFATKSLDRHDWEIVRAIKRKIISS